MRLLLAIIALSMGLAFVPATPARAVDADTFRSVVSVLPVWPGRAQGGSGAPPGSAPEGSGVVVRPGVVATAWHVIEPAERIDVRLFDGRILPARLLARDAASDIAILEIDVDLPVFEVSRKPGLADPVCAIGNAFGLGLSVTCGVISALSVTNAGFNPVEDFVQTDAATNPGMSGGALVDADGRLVGLLSAIFAGPSDSNIGVNFAVSPLLLSRVVDALLTNGAVTYPSPGWRLGPLEGAARARIAAPVVAALAPDGLAARSGVQEGDLVLRIADRRVRTPRDAIAAFAVIPEGVEEVVLSVEREGTERLVTLALAESVGAAQATAERPSNDDCPHPEPVCDMRQAVFPISSFDPVGSATRVGPTFLVTNRHVIGDQSGAVVHTPAGPREAVVVPSAYRGDLVLLKVDGLPGDGAIASLERGSIAASDVFHAIGADIARQEIRVFEPGDLIAPPAPEAPLGRVHVSARMQPGVSGGALVDGEGDLVAIAVGGGDGRFEAIPVADVEELLVLVDDPMAQTIQRDLGVAFVACATRMEQLRGGGGLAEDLSGVCLEADNHGQLLEAGRVLGRAGDFDGAIGMHRRAAEQVPNSINARISLLVSLQIGGRFEDMTDHARWLMSMAPDDPQALRFAIQSGVWGGDPELAEKAYALLLAADPRQAEAARRFIDDAPPAPPRR